MKRSISYHRHPCEVTSDRLADHVRKYHAVLSGQDLDEIGHVRHLLESIADGTINKEGEG